MPILDIKKQDRTIEIETQKLITDKDTQKRYYIAELIKTALNRYMDFDDLIADNTYSIYTLPIANEDLAVIDFEINSLSVHIIPTIDKSKNTNVYIPQIYKQFNYKPDLFIFVNFNKNLTKMEIIGYIQEIDLNNLSIPKILLNSADNLTEIIQTKKTNKAIFADNILETTQQLILAYIDNDLSEEGKRFFLKYLLLSKEVRKNYKLFYALNCNFISIAGNSEIEKTLLQDAPQEEHPVEILEETMSEESKSDEPQTKIETFNRSNFIIDAISETNKEESEIVQESNQEEQVYSETAVEHKFYESNEAAENIAEETSSEQLTQENIELNLEAEAQDEIIDLSENEPEGNLDDKNLVENEEELSLEDTDEQEDILELGEEQNLDEFSQEDSEILSLEEDSDDDFLDIAEDTSFDLLEEENETETIEEVSDLPAESSEIQSLSPETTSTQEEQEEISTEDEEDLFSFLSEIADENQQIEEQSSLDEQNPISQEEANINEIQENTNTDISETKEEILADQSEESPIIEANVDMNNAFSNQTEQPYSNAIQENQNLTKSSSSPASKILLASFIVIALGAYGTYMYKDTILSKLGTSQEINGLSEEDLLLPPAPTSENIDEAQKAEEQAPSENNIAPPPTVTDSNQPAKSTTTAEKITNNTNSDKIKIPPAPNTPELPNIPTTVKPPKPKNINDVIANALAKDFNGVRISKISWEVSETLVENPEVKRYFTIAGKSIKNALSQDLMAATEPSFKDNVVVVINYKKDGTVSKTTIESSSGSKQIDDIILKSIKDTFNYVKMPALNLSKPEYNAKLIIRL